LKRHQWFQRFGYQGSRAVVLNLFAEGSQI